MICYVAGVVSVVMSEPSGGNAIACGAMHGATAGQAGSGGSACGEAAALAAATAPIRVAGRRINLLMGPRWLRHEAW
jgi:hypothetical protein